MNVIADCIVEFLFSTGYRDNTYLSVATPAMSSMVSLALVSDCRKLFGMGDVAKFSGNSSSSSTGHSSTKNASPESPSFICISTGVPLISMST